jgi:hypothetical protein
MAALAFSAMTAAVVDLYSKPVRECREYAAHRLATSLCDLDANEFANALSEDVRVYVGRERVSVGKRTVRMQLICAFTQIASVQLQTCAVWTSRAVAVIELNVKCERMDAVQFMFPLTAVLRFRDDLVSDIRLFTYEAGMIGKFLRAQLDSRLATAS